MTRILLAEQSPHAQRMAERILHEEGYTVITVSDGDTALLRLQDARPQMILASVALGGHNGFQICEFVRSDPKYSGTAVVLTLGALEALDEDAMKRVNPDAVVRKPFEASELLGLAAKYARQESGVYITDRTQAVDTAMRPTRSVVVLDPDQVRAAVTVAMDEALETLIDKVTSRVMAALAKR
jgi:CheY-like chemotaxis protein